MIAFRAAAAGAVFLGATLAPSTLLHADTDDSAFIRIQPEQVNWQEAPGTNGVRTAAIYGDPSKPGVYVVRVWFPPGVMSRPHSHPDDRYAVVLKGTWWTGTGEKFDPPSTKPVKTGGFMKHPAREIHYDGAKDEEVQLQLIGQGPGGTEYVRPEDGRTGPSR